VARTASRRLNVVGPWTRARAGLVCLAGWSLSLRSSVNDAGRARHAPRRAAAAAVVVDIIVAND